MTFSLPVKFHSIHNMNFVKFILMKHLTEYGNYNIYKQG